jgi:hypothetical protein
MPEELTHFADFSWVTVVRGQKMGLDMSAQAKTAVPALDSEIRFSFFVKGSDGKPSRVGLARVLDISQTGLCMEISPIDSDLFMEPFKNLTEPHRKIELQIFCRSHPSNIFVEGSVKWFKPKKELGACDKFSKSLDICAGVVFTVNGTDKRRELMEMIGHLPTSAICCRECGTAVSVNGAFCYECGTRLVTKRELMKNALFDVLTTDGKASNQ